MVKLYTEEQKARLREVAFDLFEQGVPRALVKDYVRLTFYAVREIYYEWLETTGRQDIRGHRSTSLLDREIKEKKERERAERKRAKAIEMRHYYIMVQRLLSLTDAEVESISPWPAQRMKYARKAQYRLSLKR